MAPFIRPSCLVVFSDDFGFVSDPQVSLLARCERSWAASVYLGFSYLVVQRFMAQGRSPIFINGHWLRGVPPFDCGCLTYTL